MKIKLKVDLEFNKKGCLIVFCSSDEKYLTFHCPFNEEMDVTELFEQLKLIENENSPPR